MYVFRQPHFYGQLRVMRVVMFPADVVPPVGHNVHYMPLLGVS